MFNLKFSLILATALISTAAVTACSSKPKQAAPAPIALTLPANLEEAISSTAYRSTKNTPRDQYRHPYETLTFFGIKPEMTVVEISPGEGWYMEILAPFLAAKGHYFAAAGVPSPENTFATEMYTKTSTWMKDHPEVSVNAQITPFSPPDKTDIAPEASADMVLTFRNVHNWMAQGSEKAAFASFFKALKPGGTLGLVEHRADPKSKTDPKAKSGYVLEKDVIKLAESVGFKLDSKSEINANPKDTKDHPEGVWTLPPTLRLKEKDQAKYVAMGESDRMTLKFTKPATTPKLSKKKKK